MKTGRAEVDVMRLGSRKNMDEITVDNFAGGGGASTGIEIALGRSVDIAINHDPDAIAMHEANHPNTKHYCEDVWQVDPVEACGGRPVALAWFSPDCKHFSRAKGGKPADKNIRGLAWVALRWAGKVHPRVIMLENVEEFQTWGPVRKGKPVKKKAGQTFRKFVSQLEALGYVVRFRTLLACDFGAPTKRKRFFMIARCDGKPIVWPEGEYAERGTLEVAAGLKKPWRPVAEVLDFNIECQSIFERKKPLAENTMKRIARGLKKFVIETDDPFIIQVNHAGKFRGQTIHEPLPTITGKHGYGVVEPVCAPYIMCNNENNVGAGLEEPCPTITTANRNYLCAPHLIQYHSETSQREVRGQKVDEPIMTIDAAPRYGLVSAWIQKYYDDGYTGAGSKMTEPLHTVTAVDHNSLVTSHLAILRNNEYGQDEREPIKTICTSPGHFAEVRAFLIKYYGQGTGQSINEPLDTVVSKDRFGLVTIHGVDYMIVDIRMRMLSPRELFNAMAFPGDYIIDVDAHGKPYPKSKQTARCGNSVNPVIPTALVRANLPELCAETDAA